MRAGARKTRRGGGVSAPTRHKTMPGAIGLDAPVTVRVEPGSIPKILTSETPRYLFVESALVQTLRVSSLSSSVHQLHHLANGVACRAWTLVFGNIATSDRTGSSRSP